MTDPDPDVYVDMTKHNQANDGIRVLMTMQTAENTEPIVEQPNVDGGNIGPAVAPAAPDATIMPPSITPGDPPPPTVDPFAGAPMQHPWSHPSQSSHLEVRPLDP